ncbi:hypothetical protein [Desulfococcus multivorans]|uniref:hypothetical protein n=1 Tax=Desulfococcus multivorans TaxID=897 RepID=UPI001268FE8F|nr:hypothetical protein [Desulfococcus multivorans]
MDTDVQKERTEIFDEVWYGIPPVVDRRKMSSEKLAILLSECEKDTPKYILIEHELNMRIAKEQAIPGYYSAIAVIIGTILGWFLSNFRL